MGRIVLDKLGKRFGVVEALRDLNLEIADAELIALLGPSGCGKTTPLLMRAGIYKPTSGQILFDGVAVNDLPPQDRHIGMVFQSYALYPHMTVFDNIAFPLRPRRRSGPHRTWRGAAAGLSWWASGRRTSGSPWSPGRVPSRAGSWTWNRSAPDWWSRSLWADRSSCP